LHVFDGQLDKGVKSSPETSFAAFLIQFFNFSGYQISPGKWLYHKYHK